MGVQEAPGDEALPPGVRRSSGASRLLRPSGRTVTLRAMAEARDWCVVQTAPLTVMLTGFRDAWNRDRPAGLGGQFSGSGAAAVVPVGAIRWLAQETGIPRKTLKNIVEGRTRSTTLSVADAIVTALGHPEALRDGTLTVEARASAPRDVRESCCGSRPAMTMRF